MITWTRFGFLGFTIPLAVWGATAVIWGSMNFKAFRLAFVVAALAVWFVGRSLNRENQGDDAPHQIWGLPMEWAGLLVAASGLGLTFLYQMDAAH